MGESAITTNIWKATATATSVSGNWSDGTKWTPSAPLANDQIVIGSGVQIGALAVTEDATLMVALLALAGSAKSNSGTKLLITQSSALGQPLVINSTLQTLESALGNDVITDFGSAAGFAQDLIDISGLGITAATFAASVGISGGTNALISVGSGTISLHGVNQIAIGITNFKLA